MEGDGSDQSLVNNIEDDEIVDFNLVSGESTEQGDEIIETNNYHKSFFNLQDTFIFVFEEDKEFIDKLLVVQEISDENIKMHLTDENQNDEFLYFDMNDNLILKNDLYNIIDIEKVEEVLDDIDSVELLITQDIFDDIEIQVEELKEKVYSVQEKKESLLTELISIYKAYGDDLLIFEISDMVDKLINIYTLYEDLPYDNSDTLDFIKNINHQQSFSLPKWIIPIVNNKKKLFKNKKDQDDVLDDSVEDVSNNSYSKVFEEQLVEKKTLIDTLEDNNYKKYMNIVYSFQPYENNDSLKIPYQGHYLRNCPCNGLSGDISFEFNKTRDPLIYPSFKDKKTSFETIVSKELLSIDGFYTLSHMFLDFTLQSRYLSLHELYFLSDYKYSYITLKKRLQESVSNIISDKTNIETISLKNSNYDYRLLNKQITQEDLGLILKNNFPNYTTLLNSIPKRIQKYIYNYDDFKRAYLCYDIDYHILDVKSRQSVDEMIKGNIKEYIRNYNRQVKRKIVKNIKKKSNVLSTKDRINLSKSFIMGIPIIPVRNSYFKKFLKRFSREPRINEDSHYLYDKYSNDKLLCKHYLYELNINKDPDAFLTLKSLYGGEVNDGIICCKVCKEYICHEDFSTLEGFSDGAPKQTNEVLNQNEEELKLLTEKQTKIKKRIQKISALFGVDLNQYDKQSIIDYYDLFNNQTIIDERYGVTKAFDKHPKVKEIKGSFKFVKPAKTQKDKINNKKNKELMMKELSGFKEYLLDCNEIFIDIFFILFIIQTSFPSYPVSSKISIDLWNFTSEDDWESIKQNINSKISIGTIEMITVLLKKIIKMNRKDPFWNNITKLLFESTEHDDIPTFNQQFMKVSNYIVLNSDIREKIKDYFEFKHQNQKLIFTKEYWTSYKPFIDNTIVANINQKINDSLKDVRPYLLKIGPDYTYENISSIRSFTDAFTKPRFKELQIPFSEIMNNESYERLFKYSLQLYGKTKSIPIINLLILRFIQTVNDPNVQTKLDKLGWSNSFKKVDSIDYNLFKEVFAVDLISYFQQKNQDDSDTIKIYFHFHINNWNGMLLNGHSKRNYSYIPPSIYPDESYEELLTEKDDTRNVVNELFSKHCFDEDENIRERKQIDAFITNVVSDPNFIDREVYCQKAIPKTKNNFEKILDFKRKQTMIKIPRPRYYDSTVSARLKNYIHSNNLLERETDQLFLTYRALIEDEYSSKQLRVYFNDIMEHNSFLVNTIQDFFMGNNFIEKDQINHFKSSFGRNVDSLSVLLNKYLENTNKLSLSITHSLQVLSRLSNPIKVEDGVYFHSHIPKQWKLSDTNVENIENYLNFNEFLLHYDKYIPEKEKTDKGFYKYQVESKYYLCFQGLCNYIKKYYQKDFNTLITHHNSDITEEYMNIFNRHNFLFLFGIMIEYIEDLKDDESQVSSQANMLFSSLEEQDRMEREDSIKICTQFVFDLMIDLLEEYIDTNWLHQTFLLTDKISRQKEREKQVIIDSLESKSDDARLVMVQKQNCGISNYFKDATKKNLSYIKTDEYKNKLDDERSEFAKEFFSQNINEVEAMETLGVDVSQLQPSPEGVEEEEESYDGYEQHDLDREDEGLDDADDDGEYRDC